MAGGMTWAGQTVFALCNHPQERFDRSTDLDAPRHAFDPPVEVTVTIGGKGFPGLATSWRGSWVSVTWSCGPGLRHMTVEPAHNVQRTAVASGV